MTYQFKYMDVPEQKRERGGTGFKVVKLVLELAVTVVVLGGVYNYYQSKTQANTAQAMPFVTQDQAAIGNNPMFQQAGIAPTAETLEQAQEMAQQFMATGDLGEFEKHTSDPGFEF